MTERHLIRRRAYAQATVVIGVIEGDQVALTLDVLDVIGNVCGVRRGRRRRLLHGQHKAVERWRRVHDVMLLLLLLMASCLHIEQRRRGRVGRGELWRYGRCNGYRLGRGRRAQRGQRRGRGGSEFKRVRNLMLTRF